MVVPVIVYYILVGSGAFAFFGRSWIDTIGHAFCKFPIISGWETCQPTLYDSISMIMPYVTIMFIGCLAYLYMMKK